MTWGDWLSCGLCKKQSAHETVFPSWLCTEWLGKSSDTFHTLSWSLNFPFFPSSKNSCLQWLQSQCGRERLAPQRPLLLETILLGLAHFPTRFCGNGPHIGGNSIHVSETLVDIGNYLTANCLVVISNCPLKTTIILDVAWEECFMHFSL